MVIKGNGPVRDMRLQEFLPPLEFFNGQLPEPLERRIGFWHKAGHGHRDLDAPLALDFRIEVYDFFGKVSNADNVFIGFCRQAHHKVELDLLPALLEGRSAGVHQIFLGNALVDDIAQALCTRFGSKGQAGFSDLLHLMCQINREAVNAQRRQGEAHFFVLKAQHQIIHQTAQTGIIRRRQRSQAHFIVARAVHEISRHLFEFFLGALPRRTIADTRLTETAATGTAAEKFQHGAVMDDIHEGHQRTLHAHGLVHILADPLIDKRFGIFMQGFKLFKIAIRRIFRLVEGRHIDALHRQQAFEETSAPADTPGLFPCDKSLGYLNDYFFALAHDKEIEEVGYRLHIVDAGAAAHDKGHILAAVFAPEGNPRQIQHIEHVGVNHLILQGKAKEVKPTKLMLGFEGKQGNIACPHFFLHIRPWCVNPLGGNITFPVQYLIENGKAQIAHAHLIHIGQSQRKSAVHAVPILHLRIPFAARVAGRLQYRLQHRRLQLYHFVKFLHTSFHSVHFL